MTKVIRLRLLGFLAIFGFVIAFCLVCVVVFSQTKPFTGQAISPQKPADPVVNFRLTLPQASSVIYAIRYSSLLDAKSANELADLLVNQANDTTLNKPPKVQAPPKQK